MINITKKEEVVLDQIKIFNIEYSEGIPVNVLRKELGFHEYDLVQILEELSDKDLFIFKDNKFSLSDSEKEINTVNSKKDIEELELNLKEKESYNLIKSLVDEKNLISKYKVLLAKAFGNGSGGSTPDIMKPFVVEKNSCCSETYLIMGVFDEKIQAQHLELYIKTSFVHFLVSLIKNTQNASRSVFAFVPIQDFNEEWTDEKLYKKYGLTREEIDFIEAMVKPME